VAASLTAPANYALLRTSARAFGARSGRRVLRWLSLCVTKQKGQIRNETPVRQITAFGLAIVDRR
jgi:hypothetical protein